MAITVPSPARIRRGVGASPPRPDGREKVLGEFAYASDLRADGMLWGATVRSPHVHARIRTIDVGPALAIAGVRVALTHDDVPGVKHHGVKIADQPVLAYDRVRYHGEAVALVAADHPETARRAAAAVVVEWEPLEPLVDAERALDPGSPPLHPGGNVVTHVHVQHGDVTSASARSDLVVVCGEYEVGMQDQAFLGPEAGLAIPTEDGVELHVATQWLHDDRRQVAACLGLPEEHVRVVSSGVGGAFGGREDLSIQVHACMLALRTRRPVKMSYGREESFFGHVHRHPGRLRYEHGATLDGELVYVRARVVLDGGAYASKSGAVCLVASGTAAGPYVVPHAWLEVFTTYTNNPPCGAMRGFGAVQTCFAYESQMDKLAAVLGMDPIELRRRNALHTGATLPIGQCIDNPAPVAELLDRLQAMELPPAASAARDPRELPGGVANTTHGEGVRRGVGYAVGFKNVGMGGGLADWSTARVRLALGDDGAPRVEVRTAACEVGQGGVTVHAQIAREELGVEDVVVLEADTDVGNAGCTAGSRQTWMTGGAIKVACEAVRDELLRRAVDRHGARADALRLERGTVVAGDGEPLATVAELVTGEAVEVTREYRPPRRTQPQDERGQGDAFLAFGFAAHRAVVDVDVELGLVRVVEIATVQDVGRALNPMAVEGQIEGGIAQGLGLALMEEIQVDDGKVRNPSFTDYLIPTILDMPPVRTKLLELSQPLAPYGLNGVGEPPTIASTPAIVAALRAATGRSLMRVPVRPDDIVEPA